MEATTHAGSSPAVNAASCQVLTFGLGNELYGVDILAVREIRGWAPVTPLPKAPEHVLGVLNLRGSIVPIIDLRARFGMERTQFTPFTVVIVLSVGAGAERRELGLVVDSVSDVVNIDLGQLRQAPSIESQQAADFIRGLANVAEKMMILVDTEKLLSRPALAAASAAVTH